MFLFKVAYYAAGVISALLMTLLFLSGLFTKPGAGETWVNRVIVLVAGVAGAALLFMTFRLGHQQGQWAAGLGMAVVALVAFVVIMFGGMLMFTKVHWQ